MRTLQAFELPLQLVEFTLPIPQTAHILGVYETDGLVAWALFDKEEEGETVFHAFRAGDEVPDNLEFVASCQRRNGIVVMIFRDRGK